MKKHQNFKFGTYIYTRGKSIASMVVWKYKWYSYKHWHSYKYGTHTNIYEFMTLCFWTSLPTSQYCRFLLYLINRYHTSNRSHTIQNAKIWHSYKHVFWCHCPCISITSLRCCTVILHLTDYNGVSSLTIMVENATWVYFPMALVHTLCFWTSMPTF